MPRKKTPLTLQACSVAVVATMLNNLNIKLQGNVASSVSNALAKCNPFMCYPGTVIQEIITFMGQFTRGSQEKVIHKEVLQLLLCRNMEQLDLSPIRIHENELAEVITSIAPLANNIHSFSIFAENFGMVPRDQYNEMLTTTGVGTAMTNLCMQLTSVTHLYLHNVCYDGLMDAIGQYCPSLHIFRALSENVSDVGLTSLCKNLKDPMDTQLRCQKLQKISLDPRAEGISCDGIKSLLQYLPKISEVEGCVIGQVLEEIHREDWETIDAKYNLKHFMYDWRESRNHPLLAVKILLKTCPFITTLKLLEPTNEALVELGSLKHLTSISVITYTAHATFDEGVLPLLERAGSNVVKLSLSLKRINLSAIDMCCPKLKCLDCSIVEEVYHRGLHKSNPFLCLEDLVFHANSRNTLSTDNLKMLLLYCRDLQYLYISCCINFTDALLQQILSVNPLRKLKYLHLMYVERLTATGVQLLVSQESDLKRIWLFDAAGIYKIALRKIKDQINALNLDLRINDDL